MPTNKQTTPDTPMQKHTQEIIREAVKQINEHLSDLGMINDVACLPRSTLEMLLDIEVRYRSLVAVELSRRTAEMSTRDSRQDTPIVPLGLD